MMMMMMMTTTTMMIIAIMSNISTASYSDSVVRIADHIVSVTAYVWSRKPQQHQYCSKKTNV